MRVTQKISLQGGEVDPARAWSAADQAVSELFRAINSIDFGTIEDGAVVGNFNARWVVYTTNAVANTDDVRRHKLGRTPVGFLQVELPNRTGATPDSGYVYWGTGPSANDKTITLRCTGTSKPVALIVF